MKNKKSRSTPRRSEVKAGPPRHSTLAPAPVPFMRNFEDAAALFEQSKDPFYLAAFLIQCWLGDLVQRSAAQYAENKNPKDRSLQSGEAWRSLREFFTLPADDPEGKSVECRVSSRTMLLS